MSAPTPEIPALFSELIHQQTQRSFGEDSACIFIAVRQHHDGNGRALCRGVLTDVIDGPGNQCAKAIVKGGQTAQLVLVFANVPDVADGLRTEPHAVVVAEIGNGKPNVLVGVVGLDLAQGSDLLIEGAERVGVAVLHAAGSVQKDVVNVGLLTHDEWGLGEDAGPTAGPMTRQ